MAYFLGIDTSTTSSKALLMDDMGKVVAVASAPHTLQTPHPLWPEQDPQGWWQAVSTSIKSALESAKIHGDQVSAIGLTGQMHGLVLMDEDGKVLRPAILWNDQRTQAQCDKIHDKIGKEPVLLIGYATFFITCVLCILLQGNPLFAQNYRAILTSSVCQH